MASLSAIRGARDRCSPVASYTCSRVPSLCLARSRVTQFRLILVCGGPSYFNYFFLPLRLFAGQLHFCVASSLVVVGRMLQVKALNPDRIPQFMSDSITNAVFMSRGTSTKSLTYACEGKPGELSVNLLDTSRCQTPSGHRRAPEHQRSLHSFSVYESSWCSESVPPNG